jgi:hypothetical protein
VQTLQKHQTPMIEPKMKEKITLKKPHAQKNKRMAYHLATVTAGHTPVFSPDSQVLSFSFSSFSGRI